MIFRERPETPVCLTEVNETKWGKITNSEKWGRRFEAKLKNASKKNTFAWGTYKKVRVNTILEPLLREMTQNHCAFCDIFPLRQSGGTIEHFRPKTDKPLLSHSWINLFYCCHKCQETKKEAFDEKLLKPDQKDYEFDSFFIINYRNFEIELNPKQTQLNQERAEITIKLYGLNDYGRPEAREIVFKQYQDSNSPTIDDFPYRYLFL